MWRPKTRYVSLVRLVVPRAVIGEQPSVTDNNFFVKFQNMKNENALAGVVPIIPTPFLKNEEIDEKALRRLVEFSISSGLQAVCLPAYASEFFKLTDEENLGVVKIAVEQSAGRTRIIAQSNSPSLKIAIRLAQANVAAGADVISLAVPRIFGLPEASIVAYLSGFLESIPNTPVLIQDFNPGGV